MTFLTGPLDRSRGAELPGEYPNTAMLVRARMRRVGLAAREAAYTLLAAGGAGIVGFLGVTIAVPVQHASAGVDAERPAEPQSDVGSDLLNRLEAGEPITYAATSIVGYVDGTRLCVTNPAVIIEQGKAARFAWFGRGNKSDPESLIVALFGAAPINIVAEVVDAKVVWSAERGSYMTEDGVPVSAGTLPMVGADC